jgi:ATP-binding cassette subfamily B protein
MDSTSSRRKFREYQRRRAAGRTRDDAPDKPTQPRQRSFLELLRALWQLLRGHRSKIVFALTTLTFATLLKLVPPAATKLAIDYIFVPSAPLPQWLRSLPFAENRWHLLLAIAGTVIATTFVTIALHLWGRWYATRSVNEVQVSLRKRVFEHAVRLPLHRVYALKSGGAASILRDDTGGTSELVFSLLYNPWRAVIQLIGSLLILVWVDWRMMVSGLLLIPLVYFSHRTWINRIRPLYRDVRAQRQDIDGYTTEAFGGMRVVRAFTRERSEARRFVHANDLLIRQQLFVWWWSRMIELVWEVFIPLASTALLVYGGYRIMQGQMTLGDLMMFLFYLAMLLDPLATLTASATNFQNNLAGLDRILDLLDEPREMAPSPQSQPLQRAEVQGGIRFDRVSFQYPGTQRQVLQDVTFEVFPGETIALVGRSGSGKTTLCNLVARFYDPTSGSIELDGRDLRDIDVHSYRSLLGVVEQDVFLFDGTIEDNIRYARRGASNAEVEQAARAAHAHEFSLDLEDQYQTVIGERGVKLSGGQRQRLAIARALLADPRILILDEATSNLDTESERYIQNSLSTLLQGRTCFVIAHRMSTVALADRIMVLDQGRLVEAGTHEELIAHDQRYRRMVELQTAEY